MLPNVALGPARRKRESNQRAWTGVTSSPQRRRWVAGNANWYNCRMLVRLKPLAHAIAGRRCRHLLEIDTTASSVRHWISSRPLTSRIER